MNELATEIEARIGDSIKNQARQALVIWQRTHGSRLMPGALTWRWDSHEDRSRYVVTIIATRIGTTSLEEMAEARRVHGLVWFATISGRHDLLEKVYTLPAYLTRGPNSERSGVLAEGIMWDAGIDEYRANVLAIFLNRFFEVDR